MRTFLVLMQLFEVVTCFLFRHHTRSRGCILDMTTSDVVLKAQINSQRASVIKNLLNTAGLSTKGLFDKSELVGVLYDYEMKKKCRNVYIPLTPIHFPNSESDYYGVQLSVNGRVLKFVIDSAATISLVKKEKITDLGLPQKPLGPEFTTSVGGGGNMFESKVRCENAIFEQTGQAIPTGFDLSVTSNSQSLPPSCDGLLGLDFISSIGKCVRFDFQNGGMIIASRTSDLIPEVEAKEFSSLVLRRGMAGLALINIAIEEQGTTRSNVNQNSDGDDVEAVVRWCQGMVDMGSLYSIANTMAVASGGSDDPQRLTKLPISNQVCAGFDGKPIQMRTFEINKLTFQTEASSAPLSIEKCIDVYAADIPGLQSVGLGNCPTVVLGLDILRSMDMIVNSAEGKLLLRPASLLIDA